MKESKPNFCGNVNRREFLHNVFLFDAYFSDGVRFEVHVNPEFETVAAARTEAFRYMKGLGQLPTVLRADPGIAHRGVVVDPSGRPVAGASVGASTVHRGPWTRTAADGSFTLDDLDAGSKRVLVTALGLQATAFDVELDPARAEPHVLRLERRIVEPEVVDGLALQDLVGRVDLGDQAEKEARELAQRLRAVASLKKALAESSKLTKAAQGHDVGASTSKTTARKSTTSPTTRGKR